MQWPKTITVTDQTVDISWLSEAQLAYYAALGERLCERYREGGAGRQVFTLSGPAGSGKSVITALLAHYFEQIHEVAFVNLGLDAFHYPNSFLDTHALRAVKGRPDTYDTVQLLEKLQLFKAGDPVTVPVYSRQIHEPVPNRIEITGHNVLMLLEGQWLLHRDNVWAALRAYSSHNLFITGPTEIMRENVIKRHIRGGRTPVEAATFYEQSDLPNTQAVLSERVEPHETLVFYSMI